MSGLVGVLVLMLLMGAFLSSASPYVTLAEAKTTDGTRLHLAGSLVPGSVETDYKTGETRFRLKDSNGEIAQIVFADSPPSSLEKATRVVAVGKLEGTEFHASQLLVKCPSKYEANK